MQGDQLSSRIVARTLRTLGVAIAVSGAIFAHAAPRTFVASTGSDFNPCSLAQPCRGFNVAIAATDPGGEVIVLDSAGYGAMTIDKSVSIVAPPGVYAGITVNGGDGITINGSNIDVALRGLTINGQAASNGIVFMQGASLVVERCQITNFNLDGIVVETPGLLVVSNSNATKNGNDGITVFADATVAITGSRFDWNNAAGISIQGLVKATIDHTVIASNGTNGVEVTAGGAGAVYVGIDSSSTSEHLGYGVYAAATGASTVINIAITRSTLALNTNGLFVNTVGGATFAAITDSDVVDNINYGITATGAGTTVRAGGNRVMRNGGFGMVAQSGGLLFSPANNYVRNNSIDASGKTADSLL